MELGSVLGFALGIIFVILSILLPSFELIQIVWFYDAPSVMITIGGTIAAVLIGYPIPKILVAMKAAKYAFKPAKVNPTEAIRQIITLANLARKEGILALEDAASGMDDQFLKKGIMLIVDGTDPELVRSILETEISYIEGRHGETRGVWEYIATQGPSWGMIGTLLGLVKMLQTMDDPSAIGPAMGVAIITTFYGSILANFIANPIANKLKLFSGEEMLMKEVLIEGMLSIQAGENPRIIEEKLKSFLAPAMRNLEDAPADSKGKEGEE